LIVVVVLVAITLFFGVNLVYRSNKEVIVSVKEPYLFIELLLDSFFFFMAGHGKSGDQLVQNGLYLLLFFVNHFLDQSDILFFASDHSFEILRDL